MDRVTYKPLGTDDTDYCVDDQEANGMAIHMKGPHDNVELGNKFYLMMDLNRSRSNQLFNLRHLRLLLYLASAFLFLIFFAQLLSYNNVAHKSNNTLTGSSMNSKDIEPEIFGSIHPAGLMRDRPQYNSYISSVLMERNSNKKDFQGEPFDDLHYPTSSSDEGQQQSSIWWLVNLRIEKYVTITNYIRAMKSFNYNASITLTTQATTEFMYHTLELCERWDGPISVAVFTPGDELLVATTLIKFMRYCLPKPLSACIRDKVTWHLVYNKQHGPSPSALGYPKYHLDARNYPLFVDQHQCPKLAGPGSVDLIHQFEIELRKVNKILSKSYRQLFNLPYPINVLRNTARLAATTKYILASDIELYPSIHLVPWFIRFISNHNITEKYKHIERFDFTLPIFEVKTNVTAPKTKQELVKLYKQKDAIFFHKWVCDDCQKFPNRLEWLERDTYDTNLLNDQDSHSDRDEEVKIFEITQRNNSAEFWEPIFIGTQDDPLYDDRLTWDGRRDKMGHMYEMCLLNYYHFVLGNAFLVHAPGIKHIDRNDTKKRINFMRKNNAIYDETIKRLRKQYSSSSNINKC